MSAGIQQLIEEISNEDLPQYYTERRARITTTPSTYIGATLALSATATTYSGIRKKEIIKKPKEQYSDPKKDNIKFDKQDIKITCYFNYKAYQYRLE